MKTPLLTLLALAALAAAGAAEAQGAKANLRRAETASEDTPLEPLYPENDPQRDLELFGRYDGDMDAMRLDAPEMRMDQMRMDAPDFRANEMRMDANMRLDAEMRMDAMRMDGAVDGEANLFGVPTP